MVMIRPPRIPKYRLHKPSGRDIYLGAHGTPDSRVEYQRARIPIQGLGPFRREGSREDESSRVAILCNKNMWNRFLIDGYELQDSAH